LRAFFAFYNKITLWQTSHYYQNGRPVMSLNNSYGSNGSFAIEVKMAVYFIRSGDYIKIGVATNPHQRMRDLQTGNPIKLEIMGAIPGSFEMETELHRQFSENRTEGEWFTVDNRIEDFITSIVALFPDYLDRDFLINETPAIKKKSKKNKQKRKGKKSQAKIWSDWRYLSDEERYHLAHLPRDERAAMLPDAPRTRRLWNERLDKIAAQNGNYMEKV